MCYLRFRLFINTKRSDLLSIDLPIYKKSPLALSYRLHILKHALWKRHKSWKIQYKYLIYNYSSIKSPPPRFKNTNRKFESVYYTTFILPTTGILKSGPMSIIAFQLALPRDLFSKKINCGIASSKLQIMPSTCEKQVYYHLKFVIQKSIKETVVNIEVLAAKKWMEWFEQKEKKINWKS